MTEQYTIEHVRELCRDFTDEELFTLARLAGIDIDFEPNPITAESAAGAKDLK